MRGIPQALTQPGWTQVFLSEAAQSKPLIKAKPPPAQLPGLHAKLSPIAGRASQMEAE